MWSLTAGFPTCDISGHEACSDGGWVLPGCQWKGQVGGITREFDATVTEQHPEERVAWKSDSGPDHAGVVTFHRLDDDKTRVTTQMDVDPEGFVENVADKLGILKARVSGDLERFKKFIESRPGETGAWRGDVSRPDA